MAKDSRFISYLLNTTREESRKLLEFSGERGSHIHSAAELVSHRRGKIIKRSSIRVWDRALKRKVSLNDDEWESLIDYADWFRVHNFKVLATEFPCYFPNMGYAGTADMLGIVRTDCGLKACQVCASGVKAIGSIGLYDIKTGRSVHNEHYAQLAAYVHAPNLKYIYPILKKRPIEYGAIIHVGTAHKRGWEVKHLDSSALSHWYDVLLASNTVSKANTTQFTIANIRDIPDYLLLRPTKTRPPQPKTHRSKKGSKE
jgi:hypothetical protein